MSKTQQENAEQFHEAARWCQSQSFYVELLATQLHITHRYYLYRASKLPRPSLRRIQIAIIHEITPLLEVPYHLIGQDHATTMIVEKLLHHFTYQKNKPLVMIFAGLSGHGRTELAKQMGSYLAVDHVMVECTEMRRETDQFGPKAPHIGYEEGSPLNNHLCNTVGKCNLVFLDEFEKAHQEVQQTLLSIWQDGNFRDRRKQTKLECTNTIWILATNLEEITEERNGESNTQITVKLVSSSEGEDVVSLKG